MSCHAMSCHVILCFFMSTRVKLCHFMLFHVMPCLIMSFNVMSCQVMPCHVRSYHCMFFMSCHVRSFHVMSFKAMLCHAMSNPAKFFLSKIVIIMSCNLKIKTWHSMSGHTMTPGALTSSLLLLHLVEGGDRAGHLNLLPFLQTKTLPKINTLIIGEIYNLK